MGSEPSHPLTLKALPPFKTTIKCTLQIYCASYADDASSAKPFLQHLDHQIILAPLLLSCTVGTDGTDRQGLVPRPKKAGTDRARAGEQSPMLAAKLALARLTCCFGKARWMLAEIAEWLSTIGHHRDRGLFGKGTSAEGRTVTKPKAEKKKRVVRAVVKGVAVECCYGPAMRRCPQQSCWPLSTGPRAAVEPRSRLCPRLRLSCLLHTVSQLSAGYGRWQST